MVQDGKIFCDSCEKQIDLAEGTRVLVEFVKGSSDQHFCEGCIEIEIAQKSPHRALFTRSAS
jgi:hypothetical protein